MKIPDEYQQLCKDLAKVLQDFNLENGFGSKELSKEKTIYNFTGRLSISDPKMSDINFMWENGRHGADQNKISISTEIRVNTIINE